MLNFKLIRQKSFSGLIQQLEDTEKEIDFFAQLIQNIEPEKIESFDFGVLPKNSRLSQSLGKMLDKVRQVNQMSQERTWEIEGFAKFTELLRANSQDLKQLSSHLINELVNYLSAIQGGIFVVNEAEKTPSLQLIACYAYQRKKFIQKNIPIHDEFAEDLLVQVFRERKPIYLNNIPQDYLKITSGLGGANPKHLFILPLTSQDRVVGVMELASFVELMPYQIRFLEKLSETIGSTIASVQANETTRVLLQETQIQAEKLRAQEEEIRQNNEELIATQEEMLRRSIELDGQLNAINNSAIIKVELNVNGQIDSVNQSFCQLFQYQTEEVIGKNHQIVVEPLIAKSAEYQNFWANLRQGKMQSGEVKRLAKNGQVVWLNATYFPVFNVDKVVYKIIKLAFDITATKAQMEELEFKTQRLITNENVMKKSYVDLTKTREELKQKVSEIEELKAQEAQRFKEKDEANKAWMNKALEKFKKNEAEFKQQIADKNQEILQLKAQLETTNQT
ncbi:MAG: GAF domain-containing protein [Microscillaceae bacterium]|jgi:PAS domain S-box-containing protein|nr:GAF domain-containing protein [Microscillaceae bacterium]